MLEEKMYLAKEKEKLINILNREKIQKTGS